MNGFALGYTISEDLKMDDDFFVMLNTQNGGYTPMMGDDEIAKYTTFEAAAEAAEDNPLGENFGYEVFQIGCGI
jgi:hypothetical protein